MQKSSMAETRWDEDMIFTQESQENFFKWNSPPVCTSTYAVNTSFHFLYLHDKFLYFPPENVWELIFRLFILS